MPGIDAGSVYSSIRIRLTQLDQDLKGVYSRLDQLEGRMKTSTNAAPITKQFDLMKLAGTAAFIAIGKAVKDSVRLFAGFEQSIANVASVSGGTAEEMAKLEQAARNAGETTRFTASQAADALYFLASAGLDASESVAALDGVLQLAGATQSDLAFTSAAVTATLSQYNLEAEEAGRVSNVFAAAIGNSQANMEKLANAMRYVGPVAGALGKSLEETTGALQILFNAGFQGEQAGTILRNVFASLADETGPVIAKLESLGVAFEDVDPTANTFAESIGALQDAGITASEAMATFGNRAGPGLITLLQAGREELESMTDAVTDTNKAAEAYAIQNDTLAGSLDRLKSVSEAVGISVGEGLNPLIRGLVDLLTNVLGVVNKIPSSLKAMGAAAAVSVIGVNALGSALSFLGISVSAALGPIGLIIAGVAALSVGVAALVNKSKELRAEKLEEQFGEIANKLGIMAEEAEAVDEAFRLSAFGGSFNDIKTQVSEIAKSMGLTKQQVVEIGLASKNVSDEYKDQLKLLQEQLTEEEKILETIYEKEIAALKSADVIGRQARMQEENRRREELAAKRKKEADEAEKARVAKLVKDRNEAELEYQNELSVTTRLRDAGAISALDANNRLITANKKLIESLVGLGYDGLKGENGDIAIQSAIELIKELTKENEVLEDQKKENALTDKEINELTGEYRNKLFELSAVEEEVIEKERERALAAVDASGRSEEATKDLRDAINDYYDQLKESKAEIKLWGTVTIQNLNKTLSTINDMTDSVLGMMTAFESGNASDILASIGKSANQAAKALEGTEAGAVLAIIGTVATVTAAIIDFFDLRGERAEAYKRQIENIENDILQQQLSNRKALLDYEYEAQVETIENIRDARIESLRGTFDEELEMLLVQLGVIQATTEQKYGQIYDNILEKAEENGVKLTDSQLSNIQEVLDAQLKADQEMEAAEKAYKQAVAQWDYDKAVADKEAALLQVSINRARALSELSWWDVNVLNKDDDIKDLFRDLRSTVQASPLPPVPKFQTGGIVPGNSFTGDQILTRQNSGEMDITPNQQAALWDFIQGGSNGGNQMMTIIIEQDGLQTAKTVANYFDNGKVRVKVLNK